MQTVDLRSDTVTHPTPEMRRAMAEAEVGDDVFGEDPTVNRLEALAARKLGKDAALFVTSGTMANLVSILTHCGRGDEVILGDNSHTFNYEQGGIASLGSVHPRPLRNRPDGTLDLDEIESAVRPDNVHFPRTRLIVLENTQNRCFGRALDLAYLKAVRTLADRHHIKIHVDGARIFNAAAALDVQVHELASDADSISFCLSKALAAPVGSVVCGPAGFIGEARRWRKAVGGGMRQAGVLAAAGIVALTTMIDRLPEDHANARLLAEGLASVEGLKVPLEHVQSNIVYFEVARDGMTAQELAARLRERDVLILPTGARTLRAVTHYMVTRDDIARALDVIRKELS
ncbi:MAG: low-specificity L-threonine aldolase [Syntrophobacteraceae bacterium]